MAEVTPREHSQNDIGPLDRERALRDITRALASNLDEQHVLELAI